MISYLYLSPALSAGNEDFPDSRCRARAWRDAALPEIEIADDADALRVRRPHHEGHAADALHLHRMRAELVVKRR